MCERVEMSASPSFHSSTLLYPPSKDVRLPVQLQRAMAAEAEAAREARAKVITLTIMMIPPKP